MEFLQIVIRGKLMVKKLIRYHRIKRKRLFAPTKTFELPIPPVYTERGKKKTHVLVGNKGITCIMLSPAK